MDLRLQILKRKAETDPSLYPAYARALERALGGESLAAPDVGKAYAPNNNAYILTVTPLALTSAGRGKDIDLTAIDNDAGRTGGYAVTSTAHHHDVALLVDCYWECYWDPHDADEIHKTLSEDFKTLVASAKQQGYDYVWIWME